jgi:hypothetical protein
MAAFQLRAGLFPQRSENVTVISSLELEQLLRARKIIFAKIDTEGAEVEVLRALLTRIAEDQPIVQFEYGKTWLPSRSQLKDVYDMLGPLGYSIGRLHPKWVRFAPYSVDAVETYAYGNYAAVPAKLAHHFE